MINIQRIDYVDTIKYICIMFVMLSHLDANTNLMWAFYSPFFLSAFFFVSGYVYKQKGDFKSFIYKKIRQLFIPWLFFSVFNIIISHILTFNYHSDLITELKWNFLQIRGCGDGIWFVAALFVAFIPFYFFIDRFEKVSKSSSGYTACIIAIVISWVLSVISIVYSYNMPSDIYPWGSSALPWHVEYIFQAMFYMVLGYMFRKYYEEYIDKYNSLRNRIIVLAIYLIIVYMPILLDIGMILAIRIIYKFISEIFGIAVVVMFAKVIKTNRYISCVGQNTLIYFALHGKVYSLIQTLLKKYVGVLYADILGNVIASSVFGIIFAVVISVILIIPTYIINRWFPFIIGRDYKKIKK